MSLFVWWRSLVGCDNNDRKVRQVTSSGEEADDEAESGEESGEDDDTLRLQAIKADFDGTLSEDF